MQIDEVEKEVIKSKHKAPEGILAYLLLASIIGNIGWILGLAYPCYQIITAAGNTKGSLGILLMILILMFAIILLAVMAVHVISLIAALKMKEGDFDKLKMYNVGSIAWIVICAFQVVNKPSYAWAPIAAGLTTLGFMIAFQKLIKLEIEKNKSEKL